MLSTRLALATLLLFLAACHQLSPTEKRLVGSWDYNRQIDGVDTITYEADHTFFVSVRMMDDRWTQCWGRWRVEGNDIIRDITYAGVPPKERKTRRDLVA